MRSKTLKEWFTNFGTMFSILGFFATIYLGVFYVPAWLKEAQNERILNAEDELLQSVKELIYNDTTLTLNELPTLIKAKEITIKEALPLSIDDILNKTTESFMEDKFLPIAKRKELSNKIELIKVTLPKETQAQNIRQKSENKGSAGLGLFSIIGAIVTVLLGVASTYFKFKIDKSKDEEIQNEIQISSSDVNIRHYGYEFEKEIEAVIKKRRDLSIEEIPNQDMGIDIVFSKDNKKYYIEVKYFNRSKVGLNTFHQMAYYLKDKIGEAWLVYNTDLTTLVSQQISDFNKDNSKMKIKPLKVSDAKDFENKLNELLTDTKRST